jgi:hypothetical protein
VSRVDIGPTWRARGTAAVLALTTTLLVSACSRQMGPGSSATEPSPRYPDPRFPSYLRPPASVEDVLPQIRQVVRNRSGLQGAGMGILQPGDTIAIVASVTAEELILEAFKRALAERNVQAIVLYDYELVGVSRDEALALRRARQSYTSEQGYMEAATWIETQFPDPEAVKQWMKGRRPDLYAALFPPARELPARLKEVRTRLQGESVGAAIRRYLEKHPTVRGVFWGKGGSTSLRRYLHPLEARFLGLFTLDNRWDAMSAIGTYPGDVWLLAEEKTMEPIVYVDRLHVTDPEGTDVSSQISPIQAERWMRGVYQRGHLYMFPNQATGRFGYSVVDYPAFQSEYLPREPLATIDGVLAGTVNHTGFYPRWEVVFRNGYVREVRGGGLFGDALREMLQYPGINDLVYPFHNPEHPGFWYLYEVAVGTHPKAFRNPAGLEQGTATPERNRSGVIHWGLGITIHHEPGSPTKSPQLLKFTAEHNLPRDHGFHTHTYFSTYRVHLRNADKWVTLLERGRMKSLDDPEVRALASRYGNPDELLTEDWRPEIPGINAPGEYSAYAANPWKAVQTVIDQVVAGTYPHFFPPIARTAARGTN